MLEHSPNIFASEEKATTMRQLWRCDAFGSRDSSVQFNQLHAFGSRDNSVQFNQLHAFGSRDSSVQLIVCLRFKRQLSSIQSFACLRFKRQFSSVQSFAGSSQKNLPSFSDIIKKIMHAFFSMHMTLNEYKCLPLDMHIVATDKPSFTRQCRG